MKFSKITISGQICTGKSSLYGALIKKLNWPATSAGHYFRNYAKKHNLNLFNAEEQNEKITKKIDNKIKELLSAQGNLIIDSWLAGIMAERIQNVLRILLICSNKIRYKRYAKREKVSIKKAKYFVDNRDKSWLKKIQKIYHRNDFFDPDNYNLVIDTSNLNKKEIFTIVLNALIEL